MTEAGKSTGFSYRPKKDHAKRLNDLIKATEHAKAFFLDKALEAHLPSLEKRYARELAEFRKDKAIRDGITYPSLAAPDNSLNDAPSSAGQMAAGRVVGAAVDGLTGGARRLPPPVPPVKYKVPRRSKK